MHRVSRWPRAHCDAVTSGLKWAPVAGPNDNVSAATAAGTPRPVASGCSAPSHDAWTAKTTAMVSAHVATPSASARRANGGHLRPSKNGTLCRSGWASTRIVEPDSRGLRFTQRLGEALLQRSFHDGDILLGRAPAHANAREHSAGVIEQWYAAAHRAEATAAHCGKCIERLS